MSKRLERIYTVELTETQMHLIASCVEDIHRLAAGGAELYNTMLSLLAECDDQCEKRDAIEDLLKKVKRIVYPDLSPGARYSYHGKGAPHRSQQNFIANTYQIYRELYHFSAVANGYRDVYASETLPGGSIGRPRLVKVEEVKEEKV